MAHFIPRLARLITYLTNCHNFSLPNTSKSSIESALERLKPKEIILSRKLEHLLPSNFNACISFQSDNINLNKIKSDEFIKKATSLRGSVMIVGPLLTRFGKASIPRPGGDKIGRRRLDTHFDGLIKLGAKFNYDSDNYFYNVSSKKLKGNI